MTASLFATGTPVGPVQRSPRQDDGGAVPAGSETAHAVARPVVDGLESSICGLLGTAAAADDWLDPRTAPRCPECARIAG